MGQRPAVLPELSAEWRWMTSIFFAVRRPSMRYIQERRVTRLFGMCCGQGLRRPGGEAVSCTRRCGRSAVLCAAFRRPMCAAQVKHRRWTRRMLSGGAVRQDSAIGTSSPRATGVARAAQATHPLCVCVRCDQPDVACASTGASLIAWLALRHPTRPLPSSGCV